MPQITRVRITNFRYGVRRVPDLMFDMETEAGVKELQALNTLIRLANGGGKSVLALALLQPIIPKVAVGARKFEAFFDDSKDHCYILLEWKKENSPEKLLIGISASAGDRLTSDGSADKETHNIKYYTFIANYENDDSPYSIKNLDLSYRTEKNQYQAATYEYARELAKKSNGALVCYAAEPRKWRKKLEEYGIYQDEWRIVAQVCSNEHGVNAFFEGMASSTALLDKFIIPQIEGKLNHLSEHGSGLPKMFQDYIEQYSLQSDKINEKEAWEEFATQLKIVKPHIDSLYNANSSLEEGIKALFGLGDALHKNIEQCNNQLVAAEKAANELHQKVDRITHEEKSYEYHLAMAAFEEIHQVYLQALEKKDACKQALDGTEYAIKVMRCAGLLQKLRKAEGELAGIEAAIRNQENQSDAATELRQLKYSVFAQVADLFSATENDIRECEEYLNALRQNAQTLQAKAQDLEASANRTNRNYHITAGKLENAMDGTDSFVKRKHLDLYRRLDGTYAPEDIEEKAAEYEAARSAAQKMKEKAEAILRGIAEEMNSIPQKKADINGKYAEAEAKVRQLQCEMDAFLKSDAEVQAIAREYSISPQHRFTNILKDTLEGECRAQKATISNLRSDLTFIENEVQAAQEKTLHIPRVVIEHLNRQGIAYTTCEDYLLKNTQDGKLKRNKVMEILERYPSLAYGIILLSDKDLHIIKNERSSQWLPALVPVFTYEQIGGILSGAASDGVFLANYSAEYFADESKYIRNILEKKDACLRELQQAESRLARTEGHLDIAVCFTYSPEWESQQEKEIARAKTVAAELACELDRLENRIKELKQQDQAERQRAKETERQITDAENGINALQEMQDFLAVECRLYEDKQLLLREKDVAEHLLEQCKQDISQNNKAIDLQQSRSQRQKDAARDLQAVYDDVACCEETPKLPGEWDVLYEQYKTLRLKIAGNISELKALADGVSADIAGIKRDIAREVLPEADYIDATYDEVEMERLQTEKEECVRKYDKLYSDVLNLNGEDSKRNAAKEFAEKALEQFGGTPLEQSQIGTQDFDARRAQILGTIRQHDRQIKECSEKRDRYKSVLDNLTGSTRDIPRPGNVAPVVLWDDPMQQYQSTHDQYSQQKNAVAEQEAQVVDMLANIAKMFKTRTCAAHINEAIKKYKAVLSNTVMGDRFFTLSEHIDGDIEQAQKIIRGISTEISEVEKTREDLIRHCVIQGSYIYDGLKKISSRSKIEVHKGIRKEMLRFSIPGNINDIEADAAIRREIELATKEITEIQEAVKRGERSASAVSRKCEEIVSSSNLLRKYIGQSNIVVLTYKIDHNPQNSQYRTWEQTIPQNSGAEKFAARLAIILSLMSYVSGDIGSSWTTRTVYLDNPFGEVSSEHILDPVFAIAKHFRTQLICFTAHNESAIASRFDVVYQMKIKTHPGSKWETLDYDGNESLGHGYYKKSEFVQYQFL